MATGLTVLDEALQLEEPQEQTPWPAAFGSCRNADRQLLDVHEPLILRNSLAMLKQG